MGYTRNRNYGRPQGTPAQDQRQNATQKTPAPQNQQAGNNRGQVQPAPVPEKTTKNDTTFVSTKIWKVHGKDKVVDFSSKLTKALPQDFANVHGIGGADHAPNSTICVTICDSTKGTGQNSVSVKYCIDVEDMPILYNAAMAARLGQFATPQAGNTELLQNACLSVWNQLRTWLQIQPYPDNSRPISYEEITAAGKTLADALASISQDSGQPNNIAFSYAKQKNNPYATSKSNGKSYAPVSQIGITYDTTRRYPWTIQISNYDAPIKQQSNGATTHNSSQAINKQEAFISLSADDFAAAMVAVERFVRLWEQRMFRAIDTGCTQYEQVIQDLRNKKAG